MGKVMISLPGEFLKDVDNLAAIEHRNRSELFREAVRYYLQRKISYLENKPINNPQVKKALGIMENISGKWRGKWDSGKIIRNMRENKI